MIDIEKFNGAVAAISELSETGMVMSQEVFSLMRQVGHIEKFLSEKFSDYKAYDSEDDEAFKMASRLMESEK